MRKCTSPECRTFKCLKQHVCKMMLFWIKGKAGPTRIWTAIAGFRVQSANRYTIGPYTSVLKIGMKLIQIVNFTQLHNMHGWVLHLSGDDVNAKYKMRLKYYQNASFDANYTIKMAAITLWNNDRNEQTQTSATERRFPEKYPVHRRSYVCSRHTAKLRVLQKNVLFGHFEHFTFWPMTSMPNIKCA